MDNGASLNSTSLNPVVLLLLLSKKKKKQSMEETPQQVGNFSQVRLPRSPSDFEAQSRSERRSHASGATSESSAKSVSVIEQTIFSFLTTFRFESTSHIYSIAYTIGCIFFFLMSMTTALPVEDEKYWLEIVLSVATIGRTWGFRWIPAIAWYGIMPIMGLFEIIMVACIFICYTLYNRGIVIWAKRIKYIIYALGSFFTITLFPMCYGMFAIPVIFFQILLSCFFVVISCEMDPKRRVSIFSIDENYILVWEIIFNAVVIILQESFEYFTVILWLRYAVYLVAILISIIITFRYLPFYDLWVNAFYSSILFSRLFGGFLICVVLCIQKYNLNDDVADWVSAIFVVIVVIGYIAGLLVGFSAMVGFEFSILKIVQNQVQDFTGSDGTAVAENEEPEITVSKKPKKTERMEWLEQYLLKIQILELAVKIQMRQSEFIEHVFQMAEENKLNSARFQLLQGIYALYFSNRPGLSYMLLRNAISDWNPDPLLRITIWIRYHDINSFFKNSVHNERVDKLLLSTRRLEIQLEHELKQFFSLYIQKSGLAKITASAENINYYFNTIRSVYYNLTRNYKLSKVFFYYANFVDTFEKNAPRATALMEYAKILQEEEEEKLKNNENFDRKKKKLIRKKNKVTPTLSGSDNQSISSGSSIRNRKSKYTVPTHTIAPTNQVAPIADENHFDKKSVEDSLQYEIDAVAPENDGESSEDSYRTMIASQKSQIPYYLFIFATIFIPIIMIAIIAILSMSLSTSLYDLADISFVGVVPFLPLQFVRQVRMNSFYPSIVTYDSIVKTADYYSRSFDSMLVDGKYWPGIPCTIAYPLVTMTNPSDPQSASVRFVYRKASLADLASLLENSMQLIVSTMKENKEQMSNLDSNQPFLFIWANSYQMLKYATTFFNSYLNIFDSRIRDFQISFFTVGSGLYALRMLLLLSTTVGITMYLFFEKNRTLQLFMDIPSELFASAYRGLESKSSSTKHNNKVYSRSTSGYPLRVLIILIYVVYLFFEFVYLITTYGIFATNVGDFQKDIGLISHLVTFAAASNQVNFLSNEYIFYQNSSSLLKNSFYFSDDNGTSLPLTTLPIPSSTDLFEEWNTVIQGDATAYGLLDNSVPIRNQIVSGIPCFSNNTSTSSIPNELLSFQNTSVCGIPLSRLALSYISQITQTIEISSVNISTASQLIPVDFFTNQYIMSEYIITSMELIADEIIATHDLKEKFMLYAGIFAACLVAIIIMLGIPLYYLWSRVLNQTHMIRQLLLLLDVEALSNVPSIREFIVHYRVNNFGKMFKKLDQEKTASIIQAAADAVFVMDKRCKIHEVNSACTDLTGYLSAELLGEHGRIIFGEFAQFIVNQVFGDGKSLTKEVELLTKTGTVPVRLSVSLGRWNEQQMVCIFARDITLEKKQNELVALEKQNSEKLLLNILPSHVAQRLKNGETQIAEKFEDVTILFSDMCNFTVFSSTLSPIELIGILNDVVTAFDDLSIKHGLEKIKTIGDAYLLVGGLSPISVKDHPKRVVSMGVDMVNFMKEYNTKRGFTDENGRIIRIRVGIHTGSISAGIIGKIKFVYDVFGDAINLASRMESHGIPMRVHISRETYTRVFDLYQFEERTVDIKGKGEMKTYLLR